MGVRCFSAGYWIWFFLLASILCPAGTSGFSPAAAPQSNAQAREFGEGQAAESDPKLTSLFERAQEAQSRGDFRAAAADYQDILNLQPHLAGALMNLGLMLHLLGEYSQAVDKFQAALRESPDLTAANLFIGLDLLKLHEPRQALPYLQTAERLNRRDEPTALGLGQAYAALREFQPANDWYFRAAQIKPQDAEALYGLGITYLDLQRAAVSELGSKGQDSPYGKRLLAEFFEQDGRINDAVNLYKRLLDANTTWPGLRTALGLDYIAQAQVAVAKAEFQAELSQNPGFLLARLGLARTLLEQGDLDQCVQGLEDIWKIDRAFFRANLDTFLSGMAPEAERRLEEQFSKEAVGTVDPDLQSYLTGHLKNLRQGQARPSPPVSGGDTPSADQAASEEKGSASTLYRLGRYSSCAEKLEREESRDRNTALLLAQCGYYSGDYRASFLAAGQVLMLNPADFEALYWRAASSSRLAVQTLYAAGLADPNSYRVHLLLGEAYRMMKKYDASEAEYRRSLELKPQEPAVHLGLATLYWQRKEYDKAIPELQDALAGRPHDPEASYLMGDILVTRHQFSDAQPYLTAALGATGSTVYYVHALRGKIFASQDRTDDAIKEFQLALPGDDDGSFHFQLYRLYTKTGNQNAAAAALRDSEAIRQRKGESMQLVFDRSQ